MPSMLRLILVHLAQKSAHDRCHLGLRGGGNSLWGFCGARNLSHVSLYKQKDLYKD
jgi:hypothetical protein